MKQHDIKEKRILNGNTFYIYPFGAFKAANMSGEILSLVTPIIASLAPIVIGTEGQGNSASILDITSEKAAPHLARAASGVSGDKFEALLKKLLIKYENVSVELEGEKDAQYLTESLADELFCGEAQDMFILAFDVIKANYTGFFKKLGGLSGKKARVSPAKAQPSQKNTGN